MGGVIRFENRKYSIIANKLKTEDPEKYSNTDIDDFADLILERSSDIIEEKIPIPIEILANNFGLCLCTSSANVEHLATLRAGKTVRIERESKDKDFIILRNNLNDDMYRFVVAYMLSIYLLDFIGKYKKSQKYYYYRIHYLNIVNNEMEEKAQRLARALLLPKKIFVEQYNKFKLTVPFKSFIMHELSAYFGVPEIVVKKRIEEIES